MNDIEITIRKVLDDTLRGMGNTPVDVDGKANLLESGVLDSFGYLDFIGSLEDAIGIPIDISDLDEERMVSVDGLCLEVERLKAA